ncbi:MAG: N(2)-fixation sustaining protein CowN [Candidatus Dactylopiibacterium carminicum]|nr:N(2)-fixation sustaining protein CowN [Candidatus Dactylopiibacterium carminicum]PAT00482.1 MAG: N(2)-fixation sustaining protein CowN [Candidatus Dactylopiibacterium carminicum]
MNEPPCLCQGKTEEQDRYVSFIGLDCDGQARRLVGMLRPYMEDEARSNAFWQLLARKLNPVSGPRHDELFLIHAHLNILRDQLEAADDVEALLLLDKIELECC